MCIRMCAKIERVCKLKCSATNFVCICNVVFRSEAVVTLLLLHSILVLLNCLIMCISD